jgi:hypothetical protein
LTCPTIGDWLRERATAARVAFAWRDVLPLDGRFPDLAFCDFPALWASNKRLESAISKSEPNRIGLFLFFIPDL